MANPTNSYYSNSPTGSPTGGYESPSESQVSSRGRKWSSASSQSLLLPELLFAPEASDASLANRTFEKFGGSESPELNNVASEVQNLIHENGPFLFVTHQDSPNVLPEDPPEDLDKISLKTTEEEDLTQAKITADLVEEEPDSLTSTDVQDKDAQILEAELFINPIPSLSVKNKDLLLDFLKMQKFPEEVVGQVLIELAKLNQNSLEALLTCLVSPQAPQPLWCFVNFSIGNVEHATELEIERKIQKLFKSLVTRDEFSQICSVAKALYLIESSSSQVETATPPSSELVHTSPGLPATSGDQKVYQKRFIETVKEACKKIKDKASFSDLLDYIAIQRHEMADPSRAGNKFGIKRVPLDFMLTAIVGPYEKYRDLFLRSDKQKWNFDDSQTDYCMRVTPKGQESPIELTRIVKGVVDVKGVWEPFAMWRHTQNIEAALKEAERVFKELPDPTKVEHTAKGLETVMKAVGELHWWLAQSCPYQRGSAAIAKMMACAVLEHYGITAGGFGSIEPDCMALIQHPDEFIENYSKLMVFPAPQWVVVEKTEV